MKRWRVALLAVFFLTPAQYGGADNVTDSQGVALVAGRSRGATMVIARTNYLPLSVSALQPGTYRLQSAPMNLVPIGSVPGQPVYFSGNYLVTADFSSASNSGVLNTYQFTDTSVTLAKTLLIPGLVGQPPGLIKGT